MTGRSATGKTEIWNVVAKDGGTVLGEVRWFGRWTQYAFFPNAGMVFEKTCLRDIATFCVDLTGAQRRTAHARRWDK
ncbi:MAG: hypothetical protein ACRDV9_05755 [Acidimicrobiia bacterium]